MKFKKSIKYKKVVLKVDGKEERFYTNKKARIRLKEITNKIWETNPSAPVEAEIWRKKRVIRIVAYKLL